jgi:hypothetical protein
MLRQDAREAMSFAMQLQLDMVPDLVAAGEAQQRLAEQQQEQPLQRVSPPHPHSAVETQGSSRSSCSCAGRPQTLTK